LIQKKFQRNNLTFHSDPINGNDMYWLGCRTWQQRPIGPHMSSQVRPEKMAEWRERAAKKNAIVPHFFEVFPNKVLINCGECLHEFQRTLIVRLDEPTFVCPKCTAKNWIPVRFDLK
jgi:hypothetical protein